MNLIISKKSNRVLWVGYFSLLRPVQHMHSPYSLLKVPIAIVLRICMCINSKAKLFFLSTIYTIFRRNIWLFSIAQ